MENLAQDKQEAKYFPREKGSELAKKETEVQKIFTPDNVKNKIIPHIVGTLGFANCSYNEPYGDDGNKYPQLTFDVTDKKLLADHNSEYFKAISNLLGKFDFSKDGTMRVAVDFSDGHCNITIIYTNKSELGQTSVATLNFQAHENNVDLSGSATVFEYSNSTIVPQKKIATPKATKGSKPGEYVTVEDSGRALYSNILDLLKLK